MTVSEKPTMKYSEAFWIAIKAMANGLDGLAFAGFPIRVGERDGDNNLLTPRRVGALKGRITRAGMAALRSTYTIIPDEK